MALLWYPDKFDEGKWYSSETPLRDYKYLHLQVDNDGVVKNMPNLQESGDTFVSIDRRYDLSCLLSSLPPKALRSLSESRRITLDGFNIRRPRGDRDDVLSVTHDGKGIRGGYFICAQYLLGKKPGEPVSEKDLNDFLEEYVVIMTSMGLPPMRPLVGSVAKALVRRFVGSWDRVRHRGIPDEVLQGFMAYGKGGVVDASVIGTLDYPETKVDQTMSYLSVLAGMDSPLPNVMKGIGWEHDYNYDPSDAFGIYTFDGEVSGDSVDTPLYKRPEGSSYIPIVGKVERFTVLKDTMDDLKLLESLGRAKVTMIHDAWHFKGRGIRPYRRLYQMMQEVRRSANLTANFFKLVACAIWGMTLEKYVTSEEGLPILQASYWFNPVVGYTVTDKMRSRNFRARLRASGRVSTEVMDALYGPAEGNWYDKDIHAKKGEGVYTHISNLFHASREVEVGGVKKSDDKNHLLDLLAECKGTTLRRKVKSRYSFGSFHLFGSQKVVKEYFGRVRDIEVSIKPSESVKRIFSADLQRIPLKYLTQTYFMGRPSTVKGVETLSPTLDLQTAMYELVDDSLIEQILGGNEQ